MKALLDFQENVDFSRISHKNDLTCEALFGIRDFLDVLVEFL